MTTPVTDATTTPARPLRRDAAANRERVLAAAAEVFSEQGLGAGLDDVARRAGVGVGTVYRRFSSREALLDALLLDLLQAWADAAAVALALPGGAGLEAMLRALGEVQAQPRGCAVRLWSSPAADEARADVHASLAELLAAAQAAGTCRPDVTVDDLVGVLVALRALRETPSVDVALDWRRHLELCLAGLRP